MAALQIVDYLNPDSDIRPTLDGTKYNVFAVDSPRAEQFEKMLRGGSTLPDSVFLYDVEVVATGGDHSVTSGASVGTLAEEYKGHPAGSLVLTVFHSATSAYIYVEKK